MKKKYSAALIAGTALVLAASQASGQSFSITAGGPTPAPGDDILNPGPVPVLPGSAAVPLAPALEVDGFSWGHSPNFPITSYQFSVDPFSIGAPPTALGAEAAGAGFGPGDHPADIYNSFGTGGNTLLWDGDGVGNPGTATPLGLAEPMGDNVDGWDNRATPGPTIFYSLDAATAGIGGGLGADVFFGPAAPGYDFPPPGIYAGAGMLGLDMLGPGSDDIDALVVFEHSGAAGLFDATDYILFSLTPGSLSLGAGSGTAYAGLTGGDVLIASAGGGSGLFVPGTALGMSPGDNMDALDVIPEPSVIALMGIFGLGLFIRKRMMI